MLARHEDPAPQHQQRHRDDEQLVTGEERDVGEERLAQRPQGRLPERDVGAVGGIVEIAIAVHEEQKHVSVSQVGTGRHAFGAKLAVLVSEREVPRRVLDHEIEHPGGQLVVMNACIAR